LKHKRQVLKDIEKKQAENKELVFQIWLKQLDPKERNKILTGSKLTRKQRDKGTGPVIDAILKI
jgi:hypothetical protein